MKILFVLPEFYPHPGGGIATYYLQLLPHLARSGCTINVAVGSGWHQGTGNAIFQGVTIEALRTDIYQSYRQKFERLNLFPELQMHLAAAWAMYDQTHGGQEYDIIETVDWGYGYLPWVLNSGKPVIIRHHGSCAQIETHDPRQGHGFWGDMLRSLEAQTFPLADKCITYSRNNQHFWKEAIGVEMDYIPPVYQSPGIPKPEQENTPAAPYILVVGRIQHWKGPEVLCKALQKTPYPHPIYWIGRDTDFQEKGQSYNRYLTQKYPEIWGKQIIPLGAKPHEETLAWMQGALFGIVPSTWDMFNFTAIEWLSLGKRVICSRGAGAWEIIQETEGGAVFESGNADQLSQLLREWSDMSVQELNYIGARGKSNLAQVLNTEELVEKNIQVYRELLERPPAPKKPVSSWEYGLWTPSNAPNSRQATMEQWPLREIVEYVLSRLRKKLGSVNMRVIC